MAAYQSEVADRSTSQLEDGDCDRGVVRVGVLGATGLVGQRLLTLLERHPTFTVVGIAASPRSAGRRYQEVVQWKLPGDIPPGVDDMVIRSCEDVAYFVHAGVACVFSALDASVAGLIESSFAESGVPVFSNAGSHRYDRYVPIVLPLANPDHIQAVRVQQGLFGDGRGRGFIVCNPNCASTGVTMVMKALDREFGVEAASLVTLQAASGGGYPGVASLDLIDNVVPFIKGEEQKLETEPLKMLGSWSEETSEFTPLNATLSATCTRVPVRDGHLVCMSLRFRKQPESLEVVKKVLSSYKAPVMLSSAPLHPIRVRDEQDRPQPRLDRDEDHGFTTVVGRIRQCSQWHLKMVVLSHNTVLGAAGGALLNAELARHHDLI